MPNRSRTEDRVAAFNILKLTTTLPFTTASSSRSFHLLKSFVIFLFLFHSFLTQSLSSPRLHHPPKPHSLSLCSRGVRVEVIVGLVSGTHSWNSSSVRSLLGACHQDHTEEKRHPHSEGGGGGGGGGEWEGGRGWSGGGRGGKQSDLDDNRLPDEQ